MPGDTRDAQVEDRGLAAGAQHVVHLPDGASLLKRAYTRDQLDELVAQTPFQQYEIRPDGIGFELRLTKSMPV